MNLIECHCAKRYDKNSPIAFDFSIQQGSINIFLGSNGSGKTTAIKLIMHLIHPSTGQVVNHAKQIAYVPEHFELPSFVTIGKISRDIAKMRKSSVDEALFNLFSLDPKKKIGILSKGMRQKTGLILAFIGTPDLIVFDEPSNGLDQLSIKRFKECIYTYRKRGATIIIATHQINDLSFDDATIIQFGKTYD